MSPSPENSPATSAPRAEEPDTPLFLSTAPLQDPTLRTPGSDIPEAVYAVGDSETFDLHPADQRVVEALPRDNRLFALLIAFVLVAIIIFTAIYLYRDTRKNVEPVPVMPSNSSTSRPGNHSQASADWTCANNPAQPRIQRVG